MWPMKAVFTIPMNKVETNVIAWGMLMWRISRIASFIEGSFSPLSVSAYSGYICIVCILYIEESLQNELWCKSFRRKDSKDSIRNHETECPGSWELQHLDRHAFLPLELASNVSEDRTKLGPCGFGQGDLIIHVVNVWHYVDRPQIEKTHIDHSNYESCVVNVTTSTIVLHLLHCFLYYLGSHGVLSFFLVVWFYQILKDPLFLN